jgi:hypothetical protein
MRQAQTCRDGRLRFRSGRNEPAGGGTICEDPRQIRKCRRRSQDALRKAGLESSELESSEVIVAVSPCTSAGARTSHHNAGRS